VYAVPVELPAVTVKEETMAALPLPTIDLEQIADPGARRAIQGLLNVVETLVTENRTLRGENQRLRDELARLKGEQGRPAIKPNARAAVPTDHSSERERRQATPRQPHSKVAAIAIQRTETVPVDRAVLPDDAEFKGYDEVTVQDVVFRTDNVRFRKEKWYSPTTGRTYLAPLPTGYTGQFGPGLVALVLVLYFASHVSEPKILELLRSIGVQLSDGGLSNLLIKDQAAMHAEKTAIMEAGLGSSPWQHLDDTPTRVNGHNDYCQVLCNPLYTAYTTTPTKNRQTVLAVLRNGRPPSYLLNDEALGYLAQVPVAAGTCQRLQHFPRDTVLDEPTMLRLLVAYLPGVGDQSRKWILDALAVAAYHAQSAGPVVRLLVCDDAPQFTWLTEELALCWVHEGRHYKKLVPALPQHRLLLTDFLTDFWAFYRDLLAYRQQPTPAAQGQLLVAFAALFSRETGYAQLDERIARTRGKQAHLLLVLTHPELPLHNNPAELGARARVRKRDVSFGPRTAEGAQAWDTFMTIVETAKKLGVSSYHYLQDRVSGTTRLPALADLITARAPHLHLGDSWASSPPPPPF
jgi:hypothetical protein